MPRNPNWQRDEVILALDLYLREGRRQLDAKHPKVIELSKLLNQLPIHPPELRGTEFRNPAGVSMKLGNFLAVDPSYEGQGLSRGSKLERQIWEDFADNPYRLHSVAEAIRSNHAAAEPQERYEIDEDEEFEEGRILTRLHKQRERNRRLVTKKKASVLRRKGRLQCEVCGFDFAEFYGALGEGFAECHHTKPVSELRKGERTKLSDVAIVCANCHRMMHRSRPMLTIEKLKNTMAAMNVRDMR